MNVQRGRVPRNVVVERTRERFEGIIIYTFGYVYDSVFRFACKSYVVGHLHTFCYNPTVCARQKK